MKERRVGIGGRFGLGEKLYCKKGWASLSTLRVMQRVFSDIWERRDTRYSYSLPVVDEALQVQCLPWPDEMPLDWYLGQGLRDWQSGKASELCAEGRLSLGGEARESLFSALRGWATGRGGADGAILHDVRVLAMVLIGIPEAERLIVDDLIRIRGLVEDDDSSEVAELRGQVSWRLTRWCRGVVDGKSTPLQCQWSAKVAMPYGRTAWQAIHDASEAYLATASQELECPC